MYLYLGFILSLCHAAAALLLLLLCCCRCCCCAAVVYLLMFVVILIPPHCSCVAISQWATCFFFSIAGSLYFEYGVGPLDCWHCLARDGHVSVRH